MPTSVFFQNYQNSNEQQLLDDLINESIKIYGIDALYLPRTLTNFDNLLTEDAQSSFTQTYMCEMYLKNVMGFGGDRNLMSKFAGMEMRDQVIFTVARTAFADNIGGVTGFTRPREGDVVYFPLNKKCFVIRYVEAYEMMYQLGALYTWEITLELFEYSNEKFDTGIPEIDRLQQFSTNALDYAMKDEAGNVLVDENGNVITNESFVIDKIDPLAQNEIFDKSVIDLDLINFDEIDPLSLGKIGNR